mmetsp:Transcript_5732/g.10305  ORF Transcript_5732/g.10305 Transcript_5732/m.10305 type:complete len:128 (-) Transcript_5732:87-470(-)
MAAGRHFNADLAECGFQQRQQALAESFWRLQEQDLDQRVALLERTLRQSSRLERKVEPERRQEVFASNFQGPFVARGQSTQEGIYVASVPQTVAPRARQATQQVQVQRPISAFLAGQHESISKYLNS